MKQNTVVLVASNMAFVFATVALALLLTLGFTSIAGADTTKIIKQNKFQTNNDTTTFNSR